MSNFAVESVKTIPVDHSLVSHFWPIFTKLFLHCYFTWELSRYNKIANKIQQFFPFDFQIVEWKAI